MIDSMIRPATPRDSFLPLMFLAIAIGAHLFEGTSLHVAAHLSWIASITWLVRDRLDQRPVSLLQAFLTISAALSLVLTAAYYASIPFHVWSIIGAEALITLGAIVLVLRAPSAEPTTSETPPASPQRLWVWSWLVALLGAGASTAILRLAMLRGTESSIRTPWPLLPEGTFLLFACTFAAFFLVSWHARPARLARLLAGGSVAASLSWLTPLLYPLGYGFDGFIHRASEQVLLQTGVLEPKPLYYIGQYVWNGWMTLSTTLPLTVVDTWLVPVSVVIVFLALIHRYDRGYHRLLPWFALLLFPFAAVSTTTPQAFSYLIGFLALIYLPQDDTANGVTPAPADYLSSLLLATWSVSIHPLGGLPFAAAVGGLWLSSWKPSRAWRRFWTSLSPIGAILALPLAFALQGYLMTDAPVLWDLSWIRHTSLQEFVSVEAFIPRQTLSSWLDATEWIAHLLPLVMGGIGLWIAIRPSLRQDRVLALSGVGLFGMSALLERSASFTFLIEYERQNYIDRLDILALFLLVIPVARFLSQRTLPLFTRTRLVGGLLLLACIAAWTTHVYTTLPRHDAAQASSGWSAGRGDKEAVQWIHHDQKNGPYAVLANQTVSAVALETYGFFRYTDNVFYYPIPTSGPLYQVYLRAATIKATRSDLQEAARLTQSDHVYLVLNHYWWDFEAVREHLASLADRSVAFDQGRVMVFVFDLTSSEKTPLANPELPPER